MRTSGSPVPDPTVRNSFFYGKLMDAYHFQLETNYLNSKRWLLNRLVAGSGVVCGLDVKGAGTDKDSIIVTPGVAIDRWGREIIVSEPTAPLDVPQHHIDTAVEVCRKTSKRDECCLHLVLCYHECASDPTPVLAGECGCHPACAPGAIRERYCLDFRPGCAPEIPLTCRFPQAVQPGTIDYGELVKWVTREKRCLHLPKDPCIPLANIPIDPETGRCCCGPDEIDITIRPIVFSNHLLFDMLLCQGTEYPEQSSE